ncbi:unnamed protein product, partial [Didymodactylos carnosus]
MLPWGTPEVTFAALDFLSFMTTICSRLAKYDLNHS